MSGKTTERGKKTDDSSRNISRRDILKASGTAVAIGTGVNAVTGSAMANHVGPGADPEILELKAYAGTFDTADGLSILAVKSEWEVKDSDNNLDSATSTVYSSGGFDMADETTEFEDGTGYAEGSHEFQFLVTLDPAYVILTVRDKEGNFKEESDHL